MRYVKATLLIGVLSTLAILILDASGWLRTLEVTTGVLLGRIAPATVVISKGVQYSLAAVLAFAAAWATVDIARPVGKSVVAFGAIFLLITGTVVLALYGVFFGPYQAIGTIFVSYVIGMFYGRSDSGARKKVLQRLFRQRLSRKVFIELVDANTPLNFPGAEQNATVVVCEVHNHVELMESLSPEDYVAMTNLYLKTVSDYLVEIGGYLDECGGESLRAVFGAPLPREDHAVQACKAALAVASRIEALNKECDARWHKRLDFRVGINSGPMIAAAYGGSRLGSFSVAGPAVEFARRLCAACAGYGCRILIGPETFEQAQEHFEARPIEMLKRPDGRRIELYEVLTPKDQLSPERAESREHFWKGVIYYRERKWDQASNEFARARVSGIPDPALDQYILRTERARRGDLNVERTQASLVEIS